ncbi:MAG: 5'-3' exonuclease H3TH domain-containing protein, partial [Thermoguttaceae bacterium]
MKDRPRQTSLPGFEDADETQPPRYQNPPPSPFPLPPSPNALAGKTVWIIDGHSLIHQVFHALPEMSSPRGEPVGAVFGFTRDLIYLLEKKKPDYLFCAFDLPGKTFRHAMYDQYKIQRPEMDLDLQSQIPAVRRVLRTFGIPALDQEGFEADDILATVARLTEEFGGECFLVTGDKDCRQLISERVKIYNIRKDAVFDTEALREEWGIEPRQVVDFQALVGDSVDNVPGVPLIGPKCARQLLEQYGDLKGVLEHAAEVAGAKRSENLQKFRDQALLSLELVRLDAHVHVTVPWDAPAGRINHSAAVSLLREFGFRSLTKKIDALCKSLELEKGGRTILCNLPERPEDGHRDTALIVTQNSSDPFFSPEIGSPAYHLVDTPEAFEAFLVELNQQKIISLDTETTHVSPRWAKLVGLSFSWNENEAWYLPVRSPPGEKHLHQQQTLERL